MSIKVPRHSVAVTLSCDQDYWCTHCPPSIGNDCHLAVGYVTVPSDACRKRLSITLREGGHVSAHCQVTGRTPGFGNSVSHSHRRSRRRWNPNIQRKTYFVASQGRRVTLRVSTKGIKVIDRDGIEAVVARLRAAGQKI